MDDKEIIIKIGIDDTELEFSTSQFGDFKIDERAMKVSAEKTDKIYEALSKLMNEKVINSFELPTTRYLENLWDEITWLYSYKLKYGASSFEKWHSYFLNTDIEKKEIEYLLQDTKEKKEFIKESNLSIDDSSYLEQINDEIKQSENEIYLLSKQNITLRDCILKYLASKFQGVLGKSLVDQIKYLNKIDAILKEGFLNIDPNIEIQISNIVSSLEKKRSDSEFQDDNNINSDEAYFDTMTDGQLGDYEDFDGTNDNIDDWSGA